jgi:hypothetical protein
MRFFPSRIRRTVVIASLALGIGTTTAQAGLLDPGLEIEWWVNGSYAGLLNPTGVYNENQGWWTYQGFATDFASGVTLNFNLNGDPDPLISGNLTVENPFLPVVDITLVVLLPIAPLLPNGSEMQGSAAVGLTTDSGGGSLSTFGGKPLWQGLIDGVAVGNDASLFFDPFALTIQSIGSSGSSANFGAPFMVSGPAVLQSIGIEINFSLTQNDQASITSVFFVVPAPGVLGLLAIGGLCFRRRRR